MVSRESYPLITTQSLDYSTMAEYGQFVTSGAITITIPSPGVDFANLDDVNFINDSASKLLILCTNGFPGALDSGAIAAGQAVTLKCAPDGAGGFTWYLIGQTAVTA